MKRILCVVLVLVFATIISSCNGNNNKSFNDTLLRAESGNPVAQYNLGLMYSMGEGVKQNKITGKKWFSKACDNGHQKGCDI